MDSRKDYHPPVVTTFGTLAELTAACVGGGDADESFKGPNDPFSFSSPAFGDPSFCTQ